MNTSAEFPEFDLTGQVAIVTGGNSGIGRGIVLGLARAGADIAVAARNEQKTAAVVQEVQTLGRRAIGLTCDVRDAGDISRTVEAAGSELGKVSILVNDAAIGSGGSGAAPWSGDDWDEVFAVNARGPFLFARAALPLMRSAGGGKIINIASGAGLMSWEMSPAYGASKAALIHLTRTLATAWALENVQVDCIAPGAFRTPMNPMTDERSEKAWISKTPARRVGEAEEFAGIAVFLASKASDFLTGQVIAFDGGISLMSLATQKHVE